MTYVPTQPRWDWYGASLEVDAESALDLLGPALGDELRPVNPRNGYARSIEIRREDSRSAVLSWGGHNPDPYVVASGEDADDLAQLIRGLGLPHRVSRADVCMDVDEPGAWDFLAAECRRIAVVSGLKLELWQDPERPERGRTLYVGSRRSEGFVRLYEKGAKDDPSRPNWVRFEVELKPQHRDRKELLAESEPLDALGFTRWVRGFVAEQFGFAAAAAPVRSERLGDDESAIQALVKQYGRILRRRAESLGGWSALGLDLGGRLDPS